MLIARIGSTILMISSTHVLCICFISRMFRSDQLTSLPNFCSTILIAHFPFCCFFFFLFFSYSNTPSIQHWRRLTPQHKKARKLWVRNFHLRSFSWRSRLSTCRLKVSTRCWGGYLQLLLLCLLHLVLHLLLHLMWMTVVGARCLHIVFLCTFVFLDLHIGLVLVGLKKRRNRKKFLIA